jgi:hypothetical protein
MPDSAERKETATMSASDGPPRSPQDGVLHEIRVEGHLDARWADWVDGLEFIHEPDGATTLRGILADQAALHGVLNRMRDLGVPIISVRRLDVEDPR